MFERSVSTHATVTEVTTWKISCSLYGFYLHSRYLLMLAWSGLTDPDPGLDILLELDVLSWKSNQIFQDIVRHVVKVPLSRWNPTNLVSQKHSKKIAMPFICSFSIFFTIQFILHIFFKLHPLIPPTIHFRYF